MPVVAKVVELPAQLLLVGLRDAGILGGGQRVARPHPQDAAIDDPVLHVGAITQNPVGVGRIQDEPRLVVPAAHVAVVDVNALTFGSVSWELQCLLERPAGFASLSCSTAQITMETLRKGDVPNSSEQETNTPCCWCCYCCCCHSYASSTSCLGTLQMLGVGDDVTNRAAYELGLCCVTAAASVLAFDVALNIL